MSEDKISLDELIKQLRGASIESLNIETHLETQRVLGRMEEKVANLQDGATKIEQNQNDHADKLSEHGRRLTDIDDKLGVHTNLLNSLPTRRLLYWIAGVVTAFMFLADYWTEVRNLFDLIFGGPN